jgi:hypothetical protein
MNATDLERAKQLLSHSSTSLPFPIVVKTICSAMRAGREDVARALVQHPQFQHEEQQCRLLMLAVQQGWAGLVAHLLLNCRAAVPRNILSYVRDTPTMEALLAGVPEEQHADLANHACAYAGLNSCLGKLLLQQYKQQWQQRQQLEQLKLGAQQILMAALNTQKQAEAMLQEAQAAAAAAAAASAAARQSAATAAVRCVRCEHSDSSRQQQQQPSNSTRGGSSSSDNSCDMQPLQRLSSEDASKPW